MYSSSELCGVENYMKIIDKMENGDSDFGYNIVFHESVIGINESLTYILKNTTDGELKDAINHLLVRYDCKIKKCISDIILFGRSVYQVDVYLTLSKNICKKIILLKKSMDCLVKERRTLINKKDVK